ncbi:STAS domain-containing protein [Candidatus Omnitrophota bacterium]
MNFLIGYQATKKGEMMDKYFDVSKSGNSTIVKFLFSELSMTEAEEFKNQLYDLVSDNDTKFIIDMSKCSFLPSVALGILVNFTAKVHTKKGKVVFAEPTEQVKTIFRVTHLEKIFKVYNTRDEAVKSFS